MIAVSAASLIKAWIRFWDENGTTNFALDRAGPLGRWDSSSRRRRNVKRQHGKPVTITGAIHCAGCRSPKQLPIGDVKITVPDRQHPQQNPIHRDSSD